MSTRPLLLAGLLAAATVLTATARQDSDRKISGVMTTPPGRAAYMARAVIWRQPAAISPDQLRDGPPGIFSISPEAALSPDGIACTFEKPGRELGGKSPKFTCRTAEDKRLRLKYWDQAGQSGNREVFATVAASRLMWALGFSAIPGYPLNLRCDGCPENPMQGTGRPQLRRYTAMWQSELPGPVIISHSDRDQGWSWRELGDAIRSTPPGDGRTEQLKHFDALTLLGVLLQHGDRKPEQQALYCLDEVDRSAGEVRELGNGDTHRLLFERQGATACAHPAVAIVDVGATFGGAGRTSNNTTAKMNLDQWRRKRVFSHDTGDCRGDLTISLAAHDGEGNPAISEQGRAFLLEQLHRLTPDHLRAIFQAARVGLIDAHSSPSAVDDWVTAFQEKVRQIEARRCQSGA